MIVYCWVEVYAVCWLYVPCNPCFFMGVGYYILFVGSVIFVNCNATVYPPLLYFGLMPCYEPLAQWEGCFSLPA